MTPSKRRREFMRDAAGAGAAFTILSNCASARTARANEKLNVALIGLGGRAEWFVKTMPNLSNVVALCDVNDKKATNAFKKYPDLPKFKDFRKMLDKMEKEIDAVTVAVPDHSHATATACAMRHGKHVLCEKPLTRTVFEAREVRRLAKENKVASQMGNQGTNSGAYRRATELIQDGAIGDVREFFVWKDGGGPDRDGVPPDKPKIPDYLDWDLWLGPAAFRDFHPRWMAWHGWRDFGTGQLGNWATHSANLAFRALKIDSLWFADPKTKPRLRVKAQMARINKLSFPKWEKIEIAIPARGDLPPVTFHYFNGRQTTPKSREHVEKLMGYKLLWGDNPEKSWADHAGTLVVGSKGMIQANGHNTVFKLLPEKDYEGVQRTNPERLAKGRGHEAEWVAACKGGKPAWSNFDYAGPLVELLMLGNLSTQFEEELEYDPLEGKIVNSKEADKVMRGTFRKGWEL